MGQFKDIDTVLRQIAGDTNVHPSIRNAMHDVIYAKPETYVYVLLCDGTVTDVFTDKAMAEYDLHTCALADIQEGTPHDWTLITRQLNTATYHA